MIQIVPHVGAEAHRYLPTLAHLRITVFREYPYLYDGDLSYEEHYLRAYLDAPDALIVLVFDGRDVVGASSGLPLAAESPDVMAPLMAEGHDPARIFYFGESVLLSAYRGQKIGVRFFEEREAYARRLARFQWMIFCAVERPVDHPRRPVDYQPLDAFWQQRGFTKTSYRTTFSWKDLDETAESPKPMVFWMKPTQVQGYPAF